MFRPVSSTANIVASSSAENAATSSSPASEESKTKDIFKKAENYWTKETEAQARALAKKLPPGVREILPERFWKKPKSLDQLFKSSDGHIDSTASRHLKLAFYIFRAFLFLHWKIFCEICSLVL